MSRSSDLAAVTRDVLVRRMRAGELWAVIDGCHDPRLAEELHDALGFGVVSLHEGTAAADWRAVAPYLVRLDQGWLATLEPLWQEPWGILIRYAGQARDLADHLVRLLVAELPDGERVRFRYHDPRVLAPFLGACEPGERATVLGPAAALGWAGAAGGAVLHLRSGTRRARPDRGQGPPPRIPEEPRARSRGEPGFRLREAHLQAWRDAAERRLESDLARLLGSSFPEQWQVPGAAALTAARRAISDARQQGLRANRQIARFAVAVAAAGLLRDRASMPEWVITALGDRSSDGDTRVEGLTVAVERRLEEGIDG